MNTAMPEPSSSATLKHSSDPRDLPDDKRIDYVRADRWINYTAGQRAVSLLEDLLTYPTRDRMPCLLIYGATGMGKTKIISKFAKDHPSEYVKGMGLSHIPVLTMQMPSTPDDNEFYNELFLALGAPTIPEGPNRRVREACRSLLKSCQTKMLIIEEIHCMLSGSPRAQRVFFNTLRFLANDLRIPIVCAGTQEARVALQGDAQLAERFDAFELKPWRESEDFKSLIATIVKLLPLREPSNINTPEARKQIVKRTKGVTNRIFKLFEELALEAMASGRECITIEALTAGGLALPTVGNQ